MEQLGSRRSGACQPDPENGHIELSRLQRGQQGHILGFCGDTSDVVNRRLFDLGFASGVGVELVRRAPMGDPLMLRVAGAEMLLRRSEAERIIVSLTDHPSGTNQQEN